MTLTAGTKLGRYEIRSKLGEGGMGEVYLAKDVKLERTVALKILPAEVAADRKRMQRFIQEAKSASALNHPNIITIHEIEETDSVNYIATEHITGVTLRERLTAGRITPAEAIEVAIQIASALAAAHEANIIHRDVKPENVMIRRDGIVKVLDFGLAKLSERPITPIDGEAATRAMVHTAPGTVMGTATYMSPEQARGFEVDSRTDIWSLGVVLYEMVAGQTPFTGETSTDVIAAIVKTTPTPLSHLAPEAPSKLEEIISKALEKDREDRYQGIKDLLVDLRRLKKRLDFETEMERSAVPERNVAPPISGITGRSFTGTSAETVTATVDEAARPTTSAEYLATEIKRHKKGAVVILAALAVTVAVAAFGLYKSREKKPQPFQTIKISSLTNIGNATGAAISPNGEYVAHVVYEGGKNSLRVWDVATKSSVEIVPPADDGLLLFVHAFSPDSRYIYYGKQPGLLYQIAVLGGTPKKIVEKVNSGITFSPDGKRFAFVRGGTGIRYLGSPLGGDTENSLVIANADGTGEEILATRKGEEKFGTSGPDWSPDGKTLACGVYTDGTNMTVAAVSVEGGTVTPVTSQKWLGVWRVAWLRDGSGLVFSADEQTYTQLWYVSYPEGNARRITNDVNTYGRGSFSMTADSGTIGTIKVEFISNIFVAPAEDTGGARQIARGVGNPNRAFGMSWTPDGKVAYSTTTSGNADIWIMNADATGNRQLTNDPGLDVDPKVSPDGRYIVFVSTRSGRNNIWRMDADGSHPKQLTSSGNDGFPNFSLDGKWVIYSSLTSDLRKVPIDGGDSVRLTDKPVTWPTVSTTDGMIAGLYVREQNSPQRLVVFPPEAGAAIKTFDIPPGLLSYLRWTLNGRSILYVITRAETSSLWSQPVDGGAPKQLTDFKPEQIFSLDLSRDGKWLVFTRGSIVRDVILITDTGKQ